VKPLFFILSLVLASQAFASTSFSCQRAGLSGAIPMVLSVDAYGASLDGVRFERTSSADRGQARFVRQAALAGEFTEVRVPRNMSLNRTNRGNILVFSSLGKEAIHCWK